MRVMSIAEVLKQTIITCGISRYKISVDTGIEQSALSRFVHDKRSIDLETAEKLCKYFGFELKRKEAKKRQAKNETV
jgi:plasmid maintenance system antidote protein VapI